MANEKTMTKREFLNAIASAEVSEEVKDYAVAAIAKMDATNEKRKNSETKAQKANAPFVEKLENEILDPDEPKTASDVAAIFEITPQKASGILRTMVNAGKAFVEDVKVTGKGTQKGYTLAVAPEVEAEAEA